MGELQRCGLILSYLNMLAFQSDSGLHSLCIDELIYLWHIRVPHSLSCPLSKASDDILSHSRQLLKNDDTEKSPFNFLPFNLETMMLCSPLSSHTRLQDKTGCDPLEAPSTGHRNRKSDISGRGMSALL